MPAAKDTAKKTPVATSPPSRRAPPHVLDAEGDRHGEGQRHPDRAVHRGAEQEPEREAAEGRVGEPVGEQAQAALDDEDAEQRPRGAEGDAGERARGARSPGRAARRARRASRPSLVPSQSRRAGASWSWPSNASRSHSRVEHLLGRAPREHAAVEVDDAVGEPAHRGRVVGHEHGREVVAGGDRRRAGRGTRRGPRASTPAVGSSSSSSSGSFTIARARKTRCISPPESPRSGASRSRSPPTRASAARAALALGAPSTRSGQLPAAVGDDHLHRARGEAGVEALGLRQVADRAPRPSPGGRPSTSIEPVGERHEAERGLEERRLAAAVRPAQAAELAARDLEASRPRARARPSSIDADASRAASAAAHRSASSMARAIPRSESS